MLRSRKELGTAILHCAYDVLASEGSVTPAGFRFLKKIAEKMAVPPEQVLEILSTSGMGDVPTLDGLSVEEGKSVLKLLVDAALAEGAPSELEKKVIRRIADKLGVTSGRVTEQRRGKESPPLAEGISPAPDLRRPPHRKLIEIIRDRGDAVLMFTDIKGSVKLFHEYGDEYARAIGREHEAILYECLEQFHGVLVNTIGDSLFIAFLVPNDAAAAAIEMQRSLHEWWTRKREDVTFEFGIRIAIHQGPAIVEDYDIFGTSVNVASRMMRECDQDEVVISHAVHSALNPDLKSELSCHGPILPEGSLEVIEIYRWQAPWKSPDSVVTGSSLLQEQFWKYEPEGAESYRLVGESPANKHVSIPIGAQLTIIGRGTSCDIRLSNREISRQHIGLIVSGGQCWVFDLARKASVMLQYPDKEFLLKWQVDRRAPLIRGTILYTGPLAWKLL